MQFASSDWYITWPYWFVFRFLKNAILQYFANYLKQKWIKAKFKRFFFVANLNKKHLFPNLCYALRPWNVLFPPFCVRSLFTVLRFPLRFVCLPFIKPSPCAHSAFIIRSAIVLRSLTVQVLFVRIAIRKSEVETSSLKTWKISMFS